MGYVYKLDFPNGLSYVGVTTKTPAARLRQHKKEAAAGRGYAVHAAIREHGDPTLSVLAQVEDSELHAAEVKAIAEWGTLHPEGYNMTAGGVGGPICDASRNKRREVRLAEPGFAESMVKLHEGNRGRSHTPESRENMARAQKGREITEEAKRKSRASILARSDYPERCASLKAYSSTLVHSQETKERIRRSLLARPDHEAHAERLRTLRKGRVTSEETKAKQRASALARIEKRRNEHGNR